ncbi:hypothetical protein SYNPS1DRAFT_30525 [Syncephalis pseudoplumigaleata]|uniref:Uncharacterized protein n=1 Tax=Syncephalis pseudoplumigaleata TaxID=1712513 RepID=A0A4V1J139_9FUNG|nr:hypothetical protein SYNPS1DRAFT_30525 [Syncephalis pseudoplumigaleata]|eukprot:RKP23719.1 hypothetical protein SYNPS1DRAFT_30525 [Syncephalis pseudoplumigaleata]
MRAPLDRGRPQHEQRDDNAREDDGERGDVAGAHALLADAAEHAVHLVAMAQRVDVAHREEQAVDGVHDALANDPGQNGRPGACGSADMRQVQAPEREDIGGDEQECEQAAEPGQMDLLVRLVRALHQNAVDDGRANAERHVQADTNRPAGYQPGQRQSRQRDGHRGNGGARLEHAEAVVHRSLAEECADARGDVAHDEARHGRHDHKRCVLLAQFLVVVAERNDMLAVSLVVRKQYIR